MSETPGKSSANGHKDNGVDDTSQPTGAKQGADPKHKVLVVEDMVEMAEIIQAVLEHMNLTVFHETHGNKALTVYHDEHPDLVLLDIALPDMTGWKVLDTIREEQRGGNDPLIIVITAYGDPANRLMGKLQGVFSYLIKPLETKEIESEVAKALGLGHQ